MKAAFYPKGGARITRRDSGIATCGGSLLCGWRGQYPDYREIELKAEGKNDGSE